MVKLSRKRSSVKQISESSTLLGNKANSNVHYKLKPGNLLSITKKKPRSERGCRGCHEILSTCRQRRFGCQ